MSSTSCSHAALVGSAGISIRIINPSIKVHPSIENNQHQASSKMNSGITAKLPRSPWQDRTTQGLAFGKQCTCACLSVQHNVSQRRGTLAAQCLPVRWLVVTRRAGDNMRGKASARSKACRKPRHLHWQSSKCKPWWAAQINFPVHP